MNQHSWLVVWLPFFIFPLRLGTSSSPLTNIFQRGGPTTNQIESTWINNELGQYFLRYFGSLSLCLNFLEHHQSAGALAEFHCFSRDHGESPSEWIIWESWWGIGSRTAGEWSWEWRWMRLGRFRAPGFQPSRHHRASSLKPEAVKSRQASVEKCFDIQIDVKMGQRYHPQSCSSSFRNPRVSRYKRNISTRSGWTIKGLSMILWPQRSLGNEHSQRMIL